MMISKKYFLIDTFSNVMYFGSKFVFNLIVYSLFINAFDIEEYGVYIFFATLLGQFEFIQLGFATSLQKFIPIYQDKKSNNKFNISSWDSLSLIWGDFFINHWNIIIFKFF